MKPSDGLICIFFSPSALSVPTLLTWEQYSIILSAPCQDEAPLLQNANFNLKRGKHSVAFGYRFSSNRQPPIPHYVALYNNDNH